MHMEYTRKKDVFELTIDGKIKKYPIIELPRAFVEWNLGQRVGFLEHMKDPAGHGAMRAPAFGAHLPVYITKNSEETLFPANAATKGTGFLPKKEYIEYYIEKFRKIMDDAGTKIEKSEAALVEAKLKHMEAIREFYSDTEKIDLRCLAGLEIWPGVTTKNFRNDPRVSLHFLGMPSGHKKPMRYQQWQINCIWEEIKAGDPRFDFGSTLRELTLGKVGKSFVPGHIPVEHTPIRGKYPSGWILWVIEAFDKGLNSTGV